MELKIEQQCRGTRILVGELANKKRKIINTLTTVAKAAGFQEIFLPTIEPTSIYTEKAGSEILNQIYEFKDKKDRSICLRPEGTATCQVLAREVWKHEKDITIYYIADCFRYEKPQAGRYRQFTQFGVEVLNPTDPHRNALISMAETMISNFTDKYEIDTSVKRGLAYYIEDGFEISCPELGAQKQVCGGGTYKEGIGFAFGVDRLMLL